MVKLRNAKANYLKHKYVSIIKKCNEQSVLTSLIGGGYDATQTLGLGPVQQFGPFGYNVVQSILGNQPFSDIRGDVAIRKF